MAEPCSGCCGSDSIAHQSEILCSFGRTKRGKRTAATHRAERRGGSSEALFTLDPAFPAIVAPLCVGLWSIRHEPSHTHRARSFGPRCGVVRWGPLFGGLPTSHLTNVGQRKLSLFLTCVAAVAMVVYSSVVITHSSAIGQPRIVGGGHSDSGSWMVTVLEIHTNVSPLYLLPIVACGVAGILLLLWPPRKPPKLPKSA